MKKLESAHTLIEKAIEAFSLQTAMNIESSVVLDESPICGRVIIEGHEFNVFLKPTITSQNMNAVLYELTQLNSQASPILVTRYLNPNLANRLREASVQFMDTAGNSFIHQPPLHIFIKGNKETTSPPLIRAGRAFQYSGLKVIFAFLQNPYLVGESYRDIAEQAQVALGSVGWILSDLTEQGYIQTSTNKRILVNKAQLQQRWVEHYPVLKQKHLLGVFTTDNSHWWNKVELEPYQGRWGGEIAAQLYTDYLQAKDGIVYLSPQKLGEFIKATRLKKRKDNDIDSVRIELIEPFWTVDTLKTEKPLAPALLVYADLIHSKDARNLDTAKRLYEKWLN